jgi:predicted outer membrane repeat protein
MKASGLALVIACSTATTSYAKDARLEGILGHLEPSARLEQLCGFEAMKRIRNDQPSLHPDRAVIDAVSGATLSGNTAKGSGGAFRSG